jgi:predicted GNAT family acetyltransferase
VTALRDELAIRQFRLLDDADAAAVQALVDRDPIVNAVLAARLRASDSITASRLGGDLVGVDDADDRRQLIAACFCGGNLLPVGGRERNWEALGHYLGSRRRTSTSLIGRAEAVEVLWPVLARYWGAARLVRSAQPLLSVDRPSGVTPDPDVRPARIEELDRYLPAAIAMFNEELLVEPPGGAAKTLLRGRLAELVNGGQAFVRFDRRGQVAFKAEIGAVSAATCQVQGVWVRPDLRGRGLATPAMSAVIDHALRLAPSVSLYVNDFNLPARAVYDKLGMRQVATLSTVMF